MSWTRASMSHAPCRISSKRLGSKLRSSMRPADDRVEPDLVVTLPVVHPVLHAVLVELDPRREVGEAGRHPALEQVRRLDEVVVDRDQREPARPPLGVGQERDLLGLGRDEEAGPLLQVVEVDGHRSAAHSTATGFTGQPVPPGMRSGLTASRNAHRPRSAQAAASGAEVRGCRAGADRWRRCRSGAPGTASREWCRTGMRSEMPSEPSTEMPRSWSHGRHSGWRPARPAPIGSSRPPAAAPAGVAPGRHEQEVARADGHALVGLGGLEIGHADRDVAVEELDAPRPRHVEEHATTHEPVGERHHRVGARPVAAHVARRAARRTSRPSRTCATARRRG